MNIELRILSEREFLKNLLLHAINYQHHVASFYTQQLTNDVKLENDTFEQLCSLSKQHHNSFIDAKLWVHRVDNYEKYLFSEHKVERELKFPAKAIINSFTDLMQVVGTLNLIYHELCRISIGVDYQLFDFAYQSIINTNDSRMLVDSFINITESEPEANSVALS